MTSPMGNDGDKMPNASESNELANKQINLIKAAAELKKHIEKMEKLVRRIEEAQVVRKDLLDKEVSI